ncbi:MAG TPA: GntR family transcriptional regulator [Acetobacteraceae bacterium]|jgi:DNA-binding GntR family transcriptional regulator|nr:GntR family transcriptional regulator [Acetobacteraceae bacterium]
MSHTTTHADRRNAAKGRSGSARLSPQAFDGGGGPAERANLDDHIYARIKAMIVDGTLLPGERIVPEQLAGDMGVSRTPTLSALKRLSQERLITWRSRRGVFVRRLSKRELAMIFEVREVLEGLAARRAAALITPQRVEQLRRLFADIDPADTPANRRAYLSQDYLFHSGILEIAGSQPLTETTHSVNILVLAFGAGLIKSIQDGLTEHAVILEALLRRDPDAAEAAMRAHVRRSVVWLHHEADLLERASAAPRGPLHADSDAERVTPLSARLKSVRAAAAR